TLWLVPALVAGTIALERERRTLDSLLTTRLSSAEIVLGKFAGGLLQYAACLITTLPIMISLCLFGGVDPVFVLLTLAATVSIAFFTASLSILVSTSERRAARAVTQTVAIATAWCILPSFFQNVAARLGPRAWPLIRRCNEYLAASSPNCLPETLLRSGVGPRLIDSIMWMIGLQLGAGSLLVVFSIARLRRASRAADKPCGADRSLFAWRRSRHWRLFRRPACGESPVLW